VVLLFPLQLMVPPDPQFAEAVQSALPPRAGRFAASTGAGAPTEARELREAPSVAASCELLAALAGEVTTLRVARTTRIPTAIFFTVITFSFFSTTTRSLPGYPEYSIVYKRIDGTGGLSAPTMSPRSRFSSTVRAPGPNRSGADKG
jgi:hypothetical protein